MDEIKKPTDAFYIGQRVQLDDRTLGTVTDISRWRTVQVRLDGEDRTSLFDVRHVSLIKP